MSNASLLFLGKAEDGHCGKALQFCERNFGAVTSCVGRWGEPLPEAAANWDGDYIVSYLSRWVVPGWLLKRARKAAINFHPASPDYPGIGCNNFALYDNAAEYGVTCHHMEPQVDTGGIIRVSRFPVFASDDVASLLGRTYDVQLALFYEVASLMAAGKELPRSHEKWTRKPYSRKEFNELGRITPGMGAEEIGRRVRACAFGSWRPTLDLHGFRFEFAKRLDG